MIITGPTLLLQYYTTQQQQLPLLTLTILLLLVIFMLLQSSPAPVLSFFMVCPTFQPSKRNFYVVDGHNDDNDDYDMTTKQQ